MPDQWTIMFQTGVGIPPIGTAAIPLQVLTAALPITNGQLIGPAAASMPVVNWAITGGNSNNYFAIDPGSGNITFTSTASTGQVNVTNNVYSVPNTAKPGYLSPILDPTFNQKIIRVTGNPGDSIAGLTGSFVHGIDDVWQQHETFEYSLDSAWNADGTLLYLNSRCFAADCSAPGDFLPADFSSPDFSQFTSSNTAAPLYLDGNTYAPLYCWGHEPGPDRRLWHPTNPNLQLFVNGNTINSFAPVTGVTTVLSTISGYSGFQISGGFKGGITNDGNSLAIYATRSSDSHLVLFVYNYASGVKSPDLDLTTANFWLSTLNPPALNAFDAAEISSLGNYVVITDTDDRHYILSAITMNLLQTWPEYGQPSHGDLTVDSNGDELMVGTAKSPPFSGNVIKRRLADGSITPLVTQGFSSHQSCRNLQRPGWVYATYSYLNPSWPPYGLETVAIALDTSGRVERSAFNMGGVYQYYSEEQGCSSNNGKKYAFKSNWDWWNWTSGGTVPQTTEGTPPIPNPLPSVGTYVVELGLMRANYPLTVTAMDSSGVTVTGVVNIQVI